MSRPNTISSLSDIELLEKYRSSGDLELLGILYEKYIHLVYGVSLKYLKDPEECKDVTMSVFEKIVTELEKHEVTNFKSWLYVLTKNFCLMKLRSAKNTEVPRSLEINFENAMESDGPLHHEDKLEDDLILLESCIEELKDEQKISVQLFFIEQKCYQDIVSSTGFSLKKVKSYIQNGKRNLKLCVEKNRERV